MGDEVLARIRELNEAQASEVLRVLFLHLDENPPLVSDDEMATRESEDRRYLRTLAEQLQIDDTANMAPLSSRTVLLAFYSYVPDLQADINAALGAAVLNADTLDFGATALLSLLVVSVSAAILRPRVRVEKEVDGQRSRLRVDVEVQGIENVGEVVKAILPFL